MWQERLSACLNPLSLPRSREGAYIRAEREGFHTARQSKGRPKATGLFSTDASDRAV
jgi:hypothetical protein